MGEANITDESMMTVPEICFTDIIIKDTIDPWTIFDKLNLATDNKVQGFKYGTPRQFKHVLIKTVDPNDGKFTLIMQVEIQGNENIQKVIDVLNEMHNCEEIGLFELHSKTYTYTNSHFYGSD